MKKYFRGINFTLISVSTVTFLAGCPCGHPAASSASPLGGNWGGWGRQGGGGAPWRIGVWGGGCILYYMKMGHLVLLELFASKLESAEIGDCLFECSVFGVYHWHRDQSEAKQHDFQINYLQNYESESESEIRGEVSMWTWMRKTICPININTKAKAK